MDIRGLILINSAGLEREGQAQSPLFMPGTTDVAGKSPLARIAERLQKFGIFPATAVIQTEEPLRNVDGAGPITSITASGSRFWRAAENAFNDLAQAGAEMVILVRLGAYAEVDFERLLQFHLDRQCRVSQVFHDGQTLDIFCISASRRNDAASLFRSQLSRCRSECPLFEHVGYTNPLADARDLRQFAVDILMMRTETAPAGEQLRPGIWIGERAQIEKGARVLAPAFIGSFARVRSGAVITRCSAIEQHAQVDCGTVVENSSVLSYSYLGAGLDLAHCLAGMGYIANLRRGAMVEVRDRKLLRQSASSSGHELLATAADLVTFVPRQFWRGIFGGTNGRRPDLTEALRRRSPGLGGASSYQPPDCDSEGANEFSSGFVVARTNGRQ